MYPLAMALMGAAVARKGKADELDDLDRADERAIRREANAFEGKRRARMEADWQRQDANRNALATAAAPVAPTDGTVYQPQNDDEPNEDGTPRAMLPNPTAGTLKVGDQRFTDPAAAAAAAVVENTPERASGRISRALMAQGDVAGARAERTGSLQEQSANIQLNQSKQAEADARWTRTLHEGMRSGGFKGLAKVLTDSAGDGMGGKARFRDVASRDGKSVTIEQIDESGQALGVVGTFQNDEEGLLQAGFLLDRGTKPERKLEHLQGVRRFELERGDKDRDYKLREQEAARRGVHEARMLTLAERQANAAERKGTADQDFDAKTAAEIAKTVVEKEALEASVSGKPWSGAQIAKRKDEIVLSMQKTHNNRLVETTVARELTLAQQNPAAYAAVYAAAQRQLKLPRERLEQMGFKAPDGVGPAPERDQWIRNAPPGSATRSPAAPPRALMTAPQRLEAQAASTSTADEVLGKRLDAAREAHADARQRYLSYGSRQKAVDPKGFALIEAEFRRTQMAEQETLAAYQRALPPVAHRPFVP